MAEQISVPVEFVCRKKRLTGMPALQAEEKIAKGEACPNDNRTEWVVVDKGLNRKEIIAAALKQFPDACPLCLLVPIGREVDIRL